MSYKKIWLATLLVFAVVFLGGCTKKMAEKTAERAIEQNVGGRAEVDLQNDQVTIQTEQGTYQAGEDVALPADWPEDIYVIAGRIMAAMQVADNDGYSVSVATEKTVGEVKTEYENELKNSGWTLNLQMDYGDSAMVSATKGERTVTVSITASSEETTVTIVTGTN